MCDDTLEFLAEQDAESPKQTTDKKCQHRGINVTPLKGDSDCGRPATWLVSTKSGYCLAFVCSAHIHWYRNLKMNISIFKDIKIEPYSG